MDEVGEEQPEKRHGGDRIDPLGGPADARWAPRPSSGGISVLPALNSRGGVCAAPPERPTALAVFGGSEPGQPAKRAQGSGPDWRVGLPPSRPDTRASGGHAGDVAVLQRGVSQQHGMLGTAGSEAGVDHPSVRGDPGAFEVRGEPGGFEHRDTTTAIRATVAEKTAGLPVCRACGSSALRQRFRAAGLSGSFVSAGPPVRMAGGCGPVGCVPTGCSPPVPDKVPATDQHASGDVRFRIPGRRSPHHP